MEDKKKNITETKGDESECKSEQNPEPKPCGAYKSK